jgi:hypothetical protein
MPVPEYYSPERVRKAAEAVREETQRTSGFSDRARQSLFNRAADAGLLDDALDELAEELGRGSFRYEIFAIINRRMTTHTIFLIALH